MAKKKITVISKKTNQSFISTHKYLLWLILIFVILIIAIGFIYKIKGNNVPPPSPRSQTTQTKSTNLKSITNRDLGISFDYDPAMQILENNESGVSLGLNNQDFPYITLSPKLTPVKDLPPCKNDNKDSFTNPCGFKLEDLTIDNKTASTYLYQCGNDCGYHIYQVNSSPPLEIKVYLSGAGLWRYINPIISTLKFTD